MFHFGTNTKLQHTPAESVQFVRDVARQLKERPLDRTARLWYIPPYTSLVAVADECKWADIALGAQNCHWEDKGAATGEMSPAVLRECGAQFVMLGHAERRARFGETNAQLNLKIHAAQRNNLGVMLCVGETADEKSYGIAREVLSTQLHVCLHGIPPGGLMVLYEPVWSVGAGGEAAQPEYVASAFKWIRHVLVTQYHELGLDIPLLYGGSVNAFNAHSLAATPECNGLGVGRAGWTSESYVQVLRAALDGPPPMLN